MTEPTQAFALLERLAADVADGEIRLPSPPDVVVRIRNALAAPDFSIDDLARLISAEPALVGTILTMANSASFRRSGKETTDLRVAVSRLGAGMVQTAATVFALRQLRGGTEFKSVEHLLAPEWSCMSRTAATGYLVAQHSRVVKPDEALIVGLIHNIGRVYLYSRAPQFPALFASPEDLDELVAAWHPAVGKAIVESWLLPEEVAEAVGRQNDPDDANDTERPPMIDVLTTAIAAAASQQALAAEALTALASRPPCQRLSLHEAQLVEIVAARDALRQSLGLGAG